MYHSQAMGVFAAVDLGRENMLDATTLLKFRRLLEQHDLAATILAEVKAHLSERGPLMPQGMLVNAAIIAAPSSTKMKTPSATPRCTKSSRATSGTSVCRCTPGWTPSPS